MGKLNVGLIAVVLAVVVGLCLVFLAAYRFAPDDAARMKDVLWGMQAGVTVLAVILGAIFAAYKWQVFRESEPHLTITHEVTHRPVGESYVHIAVTAVLRNGSRVQVELLKGISSLQLLSPTSNELVELQYDQMFVKGDYNSLQWPILDEVEGDWSKGELVVEPGESHSETFEFIVLDDVESVIAYTYFYNPRFSKDSNAAEGWGATTVYDMIEERDRGYSRGGCNGSEWQERQEGGRD